MDEEYQNWNMSDSDVETMRSYMVACEVLNIFILCASLWLIVCMSIFGVFTRKWTRKSKNKIYISCFVAVVLSLPDAIVILVFYNVSQSPTKLQCEIVTDLAAVTSSVGLLGSYVFLWLRQRAIYNNKYMRAIHGKWINGVSWSLLLLIVICLVSLACVSIVERTMLATDLGCMMEHHREHGNSSVNWESLRIMELCATTLCQVGFLILFLYPMLHNRNMIKKVCAKQKKRRDRVDSVITRCTTCAAIVILSDIATEVWIQFIPPNYPAMVIGTINGLDLFVDVLCILATFDNFTVIITAPCRKKQSVQSIGSTQGRMDSQDSQKNSKGMNDVSVSNRKTSLTRIASTHVAENAKILVKPPKDY